MKFTILNQINKSFARNLSYLLVSFIVNSNLTTSPGVARDIPRSSQMSTAIYQETKQRIKTGSESTAENMYTYFNELL